MSEEKQDTEIKNRCREIATEIEMRHAISRDRSALLQLKIEVFTSQLHNICSMTNQKPDDLLKRKFNVYDEKKLAEFCFRKACEVSNLTSETVQGLTSVDLLLLKFLAHKMYCKYKDAGIKYEDLLLLTTDSEQTVH